MSSLFSSSGPRPKRLSGDEGSSLVEYALLVSLIALVCVSALVFFQKSTSNSLSRTANSVAAAGT
jgi:Flp pilus assembly pilin Flp